MVATLRLTRACLYPSASAPACLSLCLSVCLSVFTDRAVVLQRACKMAPPAGRRRSSSGRSGYRERLSKAALLLAVALGLLALQGRLAYYSTSQPIYPRRTVPSAKPASRAAAAGLLCLPSGLPRTLLVEVPFTARDVPSLELSVGLWERTWPCHTPPNTGLHSRPDLVFGFNGNISEERHATVRARVQRLMRRPVLLECFAEVRLEIAFLRVALSLGLSPESRACARARTLSPNPEP